MEARNYKYLYPSECTLENEVDLRGLKNNRRYIKVKSRTTTFNSKRKTLYLLGALNVLFSICLLYTYVTSTILTGEISNIQTEIEALEATRDYYSMEIDKYSSIERIEEIAKYKLGMVYPNEDQFFYISPVKGEKDVSTLLAITKNEK